MSAGRPDPTAELLQALAEQIDAVLNGTGPEPRKTGFLLLVAPVNAPADARTNYVSNVERQDAIAMLREVAARFEGQPYQEGSA